MAASPSDLILLDNSEYALYNIERELRTALEGTERQCKIVPLLGTVPRQKLEWVD